MRALMLLLALSLSSSVFAKLDPKKLEGSWRTNCTQSQGNGKQGHMIETYTFEEANQFELKRDWFKTAGCEGTPFHTDEEKGTIKIGKENTNNGFNPEGTYEVEYTHERGSDKGLLWLSSAGTKIRVSRGMGSNQNTMLSLFEYAKVK